jgi:hypothetical protein
MNTSINKYPVKFSFIRGRKTSLSESPEYEILAQYLDLWRDPREVKETLLSGINSVLSGEIEFNDIGADVVGIALVKRQTTELTGSEVGYLDLELPTKDFKEIILKWLEFLENDEKRQA